MAIRKKKNSNNVTVNDIVQLEESLKLDKISPNNNSGLKKIRWVDNENVWQEIYLESDNYPLRPSFLPIINNGSKKSGPLPRSYWFNHFPSYLAPLMNNSKLLFLEFLNESGSTKKRDTVTQHITSFAVFLEWLCHKEYGPFSKVDGKAEVKVKKDGVSYVIPHPLFPLTISDITLDIIKQYKSYLYEDYRIEELQKGKSNKDYWFHGIVPIIRFFKDNGSRSKIDSSIIHNRIPSFPSNQDKNGKTEPYNDIEHLMLYQSANDDCITIKHNWKLMREIEQVPFKEYGKSLENFCWHIVNIINKTKSNIDKVSLSQTLNIYVAKEPFDIISVEEQYSEDEIIKLAGKGGPMNPIGIMNFKPTLLKVTDEAANLLVRVWLRDKFEPLIAFRKAILACSYTSWEDPELINLRKKFLNDKIVTFGDGQLARMAFEIIGFKQEGYKHYPHSHLQSILSYKSLFIPDADSIYPFFLFTHMTSGLNREVIDSLSRNIILPGIGKNTIDYQGLKNKTGSSPRREEVTVPTMASEKEGIAERLEFIKKITQPLIQYFPLKHQDEIWVFLHNRGLQSFYDVNRIKRAGARFASRHNLVEFEFDNNGQEVGVTPMTRIDPLRIRKTSIFQRENNGESYNEMISALKDKSLDTLFKYYLSSDMQHVYNNRAISAVQRVLMDEMKAFSIGDRFEGEIGDDSELESNVTTNDDIPTNTCMNRFDSSASGQVRGQHCKASFRQCLGCKQSRVFQMHLPVIAFTIIQYDEAKEHLPTDDWEGAYHTLKSRAVDCLNRYASVSEDYSSHVDKAWGIAKSNCGVFVLPLYI
jgi:hypothetical protein